MRVAVDEQVCTGQGRCYVLSPEIFSADDDGFCVQRGTEVEIPKALEDRGRLAAESCPEGAIKIVPSD